MTKHIGPALLALAAVVALLLPAPVTGGEDAPVLITRSYDKADLRTVIEDIATAAKANVIVHPDVKGTVSLRLNRVPWRAALEQVVRVGGYVLVSDRDVRTVRPRTPAKRSAASSAKLGSDYYRFRHRRLGPAKADPSKTPELPALAKALGLVVSRDGGALRYVPGENSIIFTGSRSSLEAVKAVAAVFDQPAADEASIRALEAKLDAAKTEAAAAYYADRLKALRAGAR